MLRLAGKNITKRIFFKRILSNIDVHVPSGEITGLIGPSGSGKSTLLRILAFFDRRFEGDVYLSNSNINIDAKSDMNTCENELMKSMGYVNQQDILNKNLDVFSTLYYSYRIRKPSDERRGEIKEYISNLLKRFNIADKTGNSLRTLSGGERKRVHIINELLAEPAVLFLDEPLSGLDPANSAEIVKFLRGYAKNGNIVLMTTHSAESIGYLDKVFFLSRGHLIYYGPPDGIFEHFKVNSLAESYQKILKHKPEFLNDMFLRSKHYNALKSYMEGTFSPVCLKGDFDNKDIDYNPLATIKGNNHRESRGFSVDDEFSKLISKIRDDAK